MKPAHRTEFLTLPAEPPQLLAPFLEILATALRVRHQTAIGRDQATHDP